MAVRVRLTRVGSKRSPSWRVVVADQRSPRDGRFIETIGHYDPRTEPSTIALDEERLRHWLAYGAQPTSTVRSLMRARARGAPAAATVTAEPAVPAEEPAPEESAEPEEAAAEAAPEAAEPGEASTEDAATGERPPDEPSA